MKRLFLLLAVLAAVALLGFACGDDDDDDGGGGGATTTVPADTGDGDETGEPTNGATGEPTDTGDDGGQTSFDVEAIDFAFDPDEFTVPVAETVTFNYTNNSGTPHTFTVYSDEEFTDKLGGTEDTAATSETLALTFDTAQEYFFRCEVHPQMQGEIVAE